jgi:amino acid permease
VVVVIPTFLFAYNFTGNISPFLKESVQSGLAPVFIAITACTW